MARWQGQLVKIDDYRWEIPQNYKTGMRVPGLIYASQEMLESMCEEQTLEQVANVAFLPGIVGYSFAMPDRGSRLRYQLWCKIITHQSQRK
jgi:tRNA-splicing ligase RtcB